MFSSKSFLGSLSNNSPLLLTWLSAAGVIGTVIVTHRAASNYTREILEAEDPTYPLEIKDRIHIGAKHYIKPAILVTTTLTTIFGNHYLNSSRQASLLAAYSIVSNTLTKYDEALIGSLGRRKRDSVRSAMEDAKLKEDPPADLLIAPGDVLCFDSLSGRYFSSNVTKIERAINQFNRELTTGHYLSLNEFYDCLDLPNIQLGASVGWMSTGKMLECIFHAKLRGTDQQPCIVVDYNTLPGPYIR